jgi:hypothetical protein
MDASENIAALLRAQERERFLAARHVSDPSQVDFALNRWSGRLRPRDYDPEQEEQAAGRTPFVLLTLVPSDTRQRLFRLSDKPIWDWIQSGDRKYPPAEEFGGFVRRPLDATNGALLAADRHGRSLNLFRSYLVIETKGVIEMGLCGTAAFKVGNIQLFNLTAITGQLWLTLGFVTGFYQHLSMDAGFTLLISFRIARGSCLGGFAAGWEEPFNKFRDELKMCPEDHVQLRYDDLPSAMPEDETKELVRSVAFDIEAAWEDASIERPPRCFRCTGDAPEGKFDIDKFSHVIW